jgi:dihydrofolate synthase/folylpolyglutamate synthase
MSVTLTFEDSIVYLDALYRKPILPAAQVGLRRIAYLLERLGNPQRRFRSVHVAGSNGKGSTTAMVASILQAAGFDTGRFSSPHLESINERITVNATSISRSDWERHWQVLGPIVLEMSENPPPDYALGRPAYFEVLFALMALHFAGSGVEWAVVETGMGGRFDATNTLAPDVAVITNISLEHTEVLGKTTREIAGEKAAIIKPGSHAVTAAEDPDALDVIAGSARRAGAPLARVPQEVRAPSLSRGLGGQQLCLESATDALAVALPSPPAYQAQNAATAYATVLALRMRGTDLPDEAIARGYAAVDLPGRFEVVSLEPLVVLDGAHNPAAARELCLAIDELLPGKQVDLLFAAMADKDIAAMAAALGPRVSSVIATSVPGAHRSGKVSSIAEDFEQYSVDVMSVESPDDALQAALARRSHGAALVITGSMYLVGYARHRLSSLAVAS